MPITKAKKKPAKQIDLFKLAEEIISNIGVGVYVVQRGKFVYISSPYTKITGYSDADLIGKNSLERVHPNDRAMVREKAAKSLKGESPASYEFRYIRKNGDIIWILEVITSIKYNGRRAALGSFMDITERKKMEDTLRRSEERYRTVIEEIEEGYYEMDLKGNFTFVSDAICATLGYSHVELIGMNFKGYTPKEQIETAYKTWNKVYQTGEIIKEHPSVNIRKDGTHIFVEETIAPLRNKEFKIIGFIGITRDVTKRTRMEQTIRLSEEKYRTILEDIEEGYFEVDLAGNFTFVNNTLCVILGYSEKELIGMNNRYTADKENAKIVFDAFNKLYRTGKSIKDIEYRITKKNGAVVFTEVSASLIKDLEGKPLGFRGITRDVTQRKQMEELIQQSEEKYKTIIDEMDEWYFEFDLSGNLVFINDAIVRSVGSSLQELTGLNYRAFVEKERTDEVYKIFHHVYESGEPIKGFPYEFIRSDGNKSFFEVSVFPKIDQDGRVFGFRGVAHDITERKRADEQLNYLASHDLLTGLPNRILLIDRLKMAIAQAKRSNQKLAIMMLDLDNFKNVNDTLGHMLGDELLKEIALRLTGRLRQNDTICRLGGDEFIILLPAIESTKDAVEVAKIVLDSFEQPFIFNSHTITTSISIGIAIYPDDCQDNDSLLKNADMAMYYVKAHGRNGYRLFAHINIDYAGQSVQ